MKKIDINFLKKIDSILDNLSRTNESYRDCGRCEKDIFIIRLFNKILKTNKTYKVKIKNEIYYALFPDVSIKSDNKVKYKTCGISFHYGHSNSEYNIHFLNEKAKMTYFKKIHWNDIIDIEYDQITYDLYYNVLKLFT